MRHVAAWSQASGSCRWRKEAGFPYVRCMLNWTKAGYTKSGSFSHFTIEAYTYGYGSRLDS